MITVTEHAEGALLLVRAKAAARENGIVDERDGALVVAVTAAPEQGKANEALVRVIAHDLNLRRSQFALVSGATSKLKKFLVRGITVDDLITRIEAVLTPTIYEPPDPEM
jgi:uncharacterized protein YggU (UPF0235/DUF167 family)